MSIKKTVVVLLALKITISGLAYNQEAWNEFTSYVDRLGKKYLSKTELQYRFTIYADRKAAIEQFNSEEHSFKKGINKFTDLTLEERKKFFGTVNVDNIDENMKNSLKLAVAPAISGPSLDKDNLQATAGLDSISTRSFDWQQEGKVTSVKDQGNCASSYAFASLAQLESYQLISANEALDLSEQMLIDCSYAPNILNNGCEGGKNNISQIFVMFHGIVLEEEYPYTGEQGLCKFWNVNRLYPGETYVIPARNFYSFAYNLSQATIASYFYAPDALLDYAFGIFDAELYCRDALPPNYSALAVGYSLDFGNRFIRFKASFGENWGDNGYFKMTLIYADQQNGPCNLLYHQENAFKFDLPA